MTYSVLEPFHITNEWSSDRQLQLCGIQHGHVSAVSGVRLTALLQDGVTSLSLFLLLLAKGPSVSGFAGQIYLPPRNFQHDQRGQTSWGSVSERVGRSGPECTRLTPPLCNSSQSLSSSPRESRALSHGFARGVIAQSHDPLPEPTALSSIVQKQIGACPPCRGTGPMCLFSQKR
ncbi:hypothetical protein AAFF_G00306420 [Aldrovandia affinis]|uniref:Uncharacterized protein n=1 Tax=Aldrovandia affinis TaxID=143900 RepID=A0AAD7SPS6_9TELE|nr:hypothetical protein AAFF_G00306420 [Aldrovandia affinis]